MADMMQFELVSPERRLSSGEALEVRIPGADGDLTAMADHAPLITTLRPGILTVVTGSSEDSFLVTGGFAEISASGTSVLAERAFAKSDVTQETLSGLMADFTAASEASGTDEAAKLVADLEAAGTALGLSAS